MKTIVNLKTRLQATLFLLVLATAAAYAYNDNPDVFLEGSSSTKAGKYIVKATDDVFHYQGNVYHTYNVIYEDAGMNLKIAVYKGKKCNNFIAYTSDYIIIYNCNKKGFGAREIMFSKASAHLSFNPNKYVEQEVLIKKRRIGEREAIDLIAAYLPEMRQSM